MKTREELFLIKELKDMDKKLCQNIDSGIDNYTAAELYKYYIQMNDVLKKCLFVNKLKEHIANVGFDARHLFEEKDIAKYVRCLQVAKKFGFDSLDISLALGNFFLEVDKNLAIHYYEDVFKPGFNLCQTNYFYELERYLPLTLKDNVEILQGLIKHTDKSNQDYSIDYIYTYLLLLSEYDKKYTDEYLKIINDALKITNKLTESIKAFTDPCLFEESEEFRCLCELLTLKFEYYVQDKKIDKAFDAFYKLNNAIASYNQYRFIPIRNKIYYDLIAILAKQYPKLLFFNKIQDRTLEITPAINDINDYLNKTIVVRNQENLSFAFIVKSVTKEYEVTLDPILPMTKKGLPIYGVFIKGISEKSYIHIR